MSFFIVIMAASWQSAMTSAPEQPSVCEPSVTTMGSESLYANHRRNRGQVHVGADGHLPRPDAEDLLATSGVRRAHVNESVQSTRARQSTILRVISNGEWKDVEETDEGFGSVRSADEGHARAELLGAVHFREQTDEHTLRRRVPARAAGDGYRVDLILREASARVARIGRWQTRHTKKRMQGAAPRAFRNSSRTARSESPTYLLRSCMPALSVAPDVPGVRSYLWALDGDKVDRRLRSEGAHEGRLRASGWAIQQDAARWSDAEAGERLCSLPVS
jgi:hypothetical protein